MSLGSLAVLTGLVDLILFHVTGFTRCA